MEIRFRVHCRDIQVSQDFYSRVAWLPGSSLEDHGHGVFEVAIGPAVFLKLIERPNHTIGHCSAEFNDFDVAGLHRHILETLPSHDGTADTLPPGSYCGPYDYPGGLMLSIRDPDGHLLSFAEW
ncbi:MULTISPECIES: hypothetical protein [unclassified Pseudoxanthomonas]|uniref:hypothetical protein n=1 Tax=unclassified Pseudoxanthomonas TaxID=2645906 RepID=UPI003076CB56